MASAAQRWSARAGRYKVIWRDAARVIEREIVVEPGDLEKH